jgi:hypothetical protein
MAKQKRTTDAKIKATIEGGDASGVVGAQNVFIENQIFGGTPVAHPGEDAISGSPTERTGTLPLWHVPYPRNPNFTGRSEAIARLQQELQSGQTAAVTQAIAGLGGIGKTQLALEYCYQQAARYQIVWWIRAESKETRIADLAALAERLQLAPADKSDLSSSAGAVIDWLDRTPGWLLVFDNVERPEDLEHLLPVAGRGHVLITSRHAAWGALAKTVKLNVWTSQESTQYLLKRTKEDATEANKRAATALAEALGFLPLAIEQAAAYIEESKIGISTYTELFEKHQIRLFEPRKAQPPRDQRTIATVWDISIRSVERASPGAVALLHLCAFMRPDRISKQEIENHYSLFPEPLKSTASNQIALHDAIATLRRYSLVDATAEFISVHRLVQLVVRDRLGPRDYRSFHELADRLEHEPSDSSFNVESDLSRSQRETDDEHSTNSANVAGQKNWLGIAAPSIKAVRNKLALVTFGVALIAASAALFAEKIPIVNVAFWGLNVVKNIAIETSISSSSGSGQQAAPSADATLDLPTDPVHPISLPTPVVEITDPKNLAAVDRTDLQLAYSVRMPFPEDPLRVEALVDGGKVTADDLRLVDSGGTRAGILKLTVPRRNSSVSVIAYNRNGASQPATLQVQWRGPGTEPKLTLYVLAIGISNYKDQNIRLLFPAKDAADFVKLAKAQEGGLYEEVITYRKPGSSLDSLSDREATKEEVLDGLDWIQRQVTNTNDVAMIFLAGHAITTPDQHYRFLPYDYDADHVQRTTISDYELGDYLTKIGGKKIFFIDTCFSGAILPGSRAVSTQPNVDKFANELRVAHNGLVVFTSSSGNELSQEKPEWMNGAFTKALLEGMGGAAARPAQPVVMISDLQGYVSRRVRDLTNGNQKPMVFMTTVEDYPISRRRECEFFRFLAFPGVVSP